jgi:hypothetical protein
VTLEGRKERALHRDDEVRVRVEDDVLILFQNPSNILDLKPRDFLPVPETTKDSQIGVDPASVGNLIADVAKDAIAPRGIAGFGPVKLRRGEPVGKLQDCVTWQIDRVAEAKFIINRATRLV